MSGSPELTAGTHADPLPPGRVTVDASPALAVDRLHAQASAIKASSVRHARFDSGGMAR
jgi:hypothetical protein